MTKTTDQIISHIFDRPPPPLEPGTKVYAPELTQDIKGLKEHQYVIAAIHLANDDIEGCHLIAQDNEGDPTANLLHATLHRREGDYWNSKYAAAKAFVDRCEAANKGVDDDKLREEQWEELKRIVQWTRDNYKP
ncbi:hypothetical protein IAU60_006354 [Kwoniella sp. DSM 27419]